MLRRGNLIFRYKEASAIKKDLIRLWQEFEISPDEDIFYVGGN
jgi:hypothetical protein